MTDGVIELCLLSHSHPWPPEIVDEWSRRVPSTHLSTFLASSRWWPFFLCSRIKQQIPSEAGVGGSWSGFCVVTHVRQIHTNNVVNPKIETIFFISSNFWHPFSSIAGESWLMMNTSYCEGVWMGIPSWKLGVSFCLYDLVTGVKGVLRLWKCGANSTGAGWKAIE